MNMISKIIGIAKLDGLTQNSSFLHLFSGRVVTDVGDSFYYIGAMWLVWELTNSPFFTGLAGALTQVPNALNFLVGPLVDRWQLRRVLIGTQLINGIGVLLIPIAYLTGNLSVWLLLALIPFLQFINGFVYPAQNAALPRIVKKDHLTRANSLFRTSTQTIDMVANAIAGVLIAAIGAVALFVIDSVTFAIALILFLGVTVPKTKESNDSDSVDEDSGESTTADTKASESEAVDTENADSSYFTELREGIDYIRGSALLSMLLGAMVVNAILIAVNAVLPAFADSLAGPEVYGLLLAGLGAGNLLGSATAFLVEDYSFSAVTILGFCISGGVWIAAIAVPGTWLTVILFTIAVIPLGIFNVLFGTMIQSAVDNRFLGRVTSIMTTFNSVLKPAGALIGGAAADVISVTVVLYVVGGAIIFLALYYFAHPKLRTLPTITEADETVLGLQSNR